MSLQTDQINIRIDAATKSAAEAVFNQLGISATDAVRMFYRQVVMRQGIPFEARLISSIIPEKTDTVIQEKIKQSIKRNKKTLDILVNR